MGDYLYMFKYILVGESNVGKTSIVKSFVENIFSESFEPTIGADFSTKLLTISDTKFKLQIWDTAGQEAFGSMSKIYFKKSIVAFIVFDLGNRQSFEKLQVWLEDTKNQSSKDMEIILVGNKDDLLKKEVEEDELNEFAKEKGLEFKRISAKTGEGIIDLFTEATKKIHEKILNQEIVINHQQNCPGIQLGSILKKNNESDRNKNNDKCCKLC